MVWELTEWRPFETDSLQRDMDRFWDSFFEGHTVRHMAPDSEWLPSLDVTERKGDLLVEAELPGMDGKDIDVSVSDGILSIRGEKKHEKEEKEGGYHIVERRYGSFSRSVRLPKEVESDKIKASFKNGVLKVVLPKSQQVRNKGHKITVQ